MSDDWDIAGWQQRFRVQPKVYEVWVGNESTGNFYATREGAEIEASWLRARHEKARIISHSLHSDELSAERWRPRPTPPSPPGTGEGET